MHKARSFFFVSAGIFLLALAFHLGAMTATAQAPGNPVVAAVTIASRNTQGFVTANGDIYMASPDDVRGPYMLMANVFSGPTPATQSTWGQVKAKYRPGAATQDK
jgi:hypothetical protein